VPVSPSAESFQFEIFPWNDSFATGKAPVTDQIQHQVRANAEHSR
jgi:hypothetical protein